MEGEDHSGDEAEQRGSQEGGEREAGGVVPLGTIRKFKTRRGEEKEKLQLRLRACISCRLVMTEQQALLRRGVSELRVVANRWRSESSVDLHISKLRRFCGYHQTPGLVGGAAQQAHLFVLCAATQAANSGEPLRLLNPPLLPSLRLFAATAAKRHPAAAAGTALAAATAAVAGTALAAATAAAAAATAAAATAAAGAAAAAPWGSVAAAVSAHQEAAEGQAASTLFDLTCLLGCSRWVRLL
ncbi:hypothetical protein Esti_000619 [Eimeria stiedai]